MATDVSEGIREGARNDTQGFESMDMGDYQSRRVIGKPGMPEVEF